MVRQKIAYSYIRFSRPEQLKGDSLRRQKVASEKWCEQHGYHLDTKIKLTDKGLSGYSGENLLKGKLGAFAKLVETGQVAKGSVLIVESLDRLTRQEVPTALEFFLKLLRLGIQIVTIEPEDWFKREGLSEIQLIIVIVILSRAHNESATKSRRIKEAWEKKREKLNEDSRPISKRAPTWLQLREDRSGFDLHLKKAPIVKRLIQDYLGGIGINAIARAFNREGIPPLGEGGRQAKLWHKSTILKILRSRALIGEFQPHLGRSNQDQGKRKKIGNPIEGYYPPLISEAEFYAVQKKIAGRKFSGRTGNGAGSVTNLFQGLLHDARTGSTMQMVDKGSGRQIVSGAARGGIGEYIAFPYAAVEQVMLDLMNSITPTDIVPVTNNGELSDQLEMLVGKLGKVEHGIANAQATMQAEPLLIESMTPVVRNLAVQKQELESSIEEIRHELHSTLPTADECNKLSKLVQNATGKELDLNRRRFREVFRSVVQRVDVLTLVEGHWRQAFLRVLFENGKSRIIVANCHRAKLISAGGFDGDYPITEGNSQKHLALRLKEMKARSVQQTEKNLEQQLLEAAVLKPGRIVLTESTISYET